MKEIDDFLTLIKKKRTEKRISQKEMATYLGISQPAYNNIEIGYTSLKVETMFEIAKFLDINLVLSDNDVVSENSNEEKKQAFEQLEQEVRQEVEKINSKITNLFDLVNNAKKR